MEKQKTYAGKRVMNVIRRCTMLIPATFVFVSSAQAQNDSLTANNGLYSNRIPNFSPPNAYTEVCFKNGSVLNDQHAVGGSTLGGYCAPGATGWIIEQDERPAEPWEMAKAACLLDGMRLPEPFEFKYSCKNAGAFGLDNITGNHEWATNSAIVFSNAGSEGVAAIRIGESGCAHGSFDWVALHAIPLEGTLSFRCVK